MIESGYTPDVYTGNGSTTVFAYNFKIVDEDHILVEEVVIATLARTTLTKGTHYSVSGVGEDAGGNITMVTAPASTKKLVFSLNIPVRQNTNYENQGEYFAEDHEDSFDLLTLMVQQMREELDRAPKVTIDSGDTGEDLITSIDTAVAAAEAAQAAAEAAQTAAEAAQAAAETAETNAETAETNAETAETNAETAETNAETAQAAAEAAQTAAAASASAAATSATNAATSATNAATSATNAATSATAAQTAETNAETAETNAETAQAAAEAAQAAAEAAQTGAETAETNAAASAAAAAQSAADAAAEVGLFESAVISIKTDNYTLLAGDVGKFMVMNNASAKAFTLPAITGNEIYILKNMGAGTCTITPNGAQTTEKASLAQDECVILVGDLANTKWRVVSHQLGNGVIGTANLPTVPASKIAVEQYGTDLSISGGAVATDASLGNYFEVACTAAFTLSNPTNATDKQKITWRFEQDATGGRVLTLDTKFRLGADIAATVLSTAASARDYLSAIYDATDDKWDVVAFVTGYGA